MTNIGANSSVWVAICKVGSYKLKQMIIADHWADF